MVPAWPPRWLGPSQAGDASDNAPKPGEGVLESVVRHEDDHTLLRLTMRFGGAGTHGPSPMGRASAG